MPYDQLLAERVRRSSRVKKNAEVSSNLLFAQLAIGRLEGAVSVRRIDRAPVCGLFRWREP